MTTQTEPAKKMLATLRAGDHIQFPLTELGLSSSLLTDSTVDHVCKVIEGWHQVHTRDFGALKMHDPTYKYWIVQ
ncbi:MAG: hypothetical protein WBB28_06505 [Crinalium sp.]